jgi:nitroreductase
MKEKMGLLPAIEGRRARRALSPNPISRREIETLLHAAHLAPSCSNHQPWRFIVVDDPETLGRVKESLTGGNYWAKVAPVILAIVSRRDLDCLIPDGREYFLFACGLAVANLTIQATEMGLIAHPIAGFRQAPIKETLGVPADYTLITLVILGRPGSPEGLSEKHRAQELAPRDRRPLDEVAAWNCFEFTDPAPAPAP